MKIAIWIYRLLWVAVTLLLTFSLPMWTSIAAQLLVALLVFMQHVVSYGHFSFQMLGLSEATIKTLDAQRGRIAELEGRNETKPQA